MRILDWLRRLFGGGSGNPPPPPPIPPDASGWRRYLLDRTNMERARHHVGPLVLSPELNKAAQEQAELIASRGSLLPHGDDEMAAWGQETPAEVFNGWMNSPPHRRSLLDPRYLSVGWGRAQSSDGRLWWVGDLQ